MSSDEQENPSSDDDVEELSADIDPDEESVDDDDEIMDEAASSNDEPDSGEESEEEEHDVPSSTEISNNMILPPGIERCTFDLRNLLAVNSHQLDARELYLPSEEKFANEEYLLQKSSQGCQQLISAIWNLPRETVPDAGPLAVLPHSYDVHTPRALPPPPPKAETKWDKFAKERGIKTKAKRERKVFDETTGEWKHRHGYDKANAKDKEWPIMEVKRGDDPYADPWEKIRDAKHTRTEKNLESRMRNQERAGLVPRGSARKVMKERTLARQKGKEGHAKGSALPSGIPVDLKTGKVTGEIKNSMKRGKELTHAALVATQRSTASLGKFDKMMEGEPERKGPVRKRKFEAVTPKKAASSTETERGMKVLKTLMNGGAKRDKAKRDGSLAKGETAYDYDFDDGLGSGTFKKKKGRAGAGKLKKVTKKRIK